MVAIDIGFFILMIIGVVFFRIELEVEVFDEFRIAVVIFMYNLNFLLGINSEIGVFLRMCMKY